jgi:predicted transcriptional regulator
VARRRSPDVIALELLNVIEAVGESSKWDLVKVLGNDVMFKNWVDDFFLPEGILVERREGRNYFYTMTELGSQFHRFLRNGNIIKLFSRVSGRRLK